ncbi:bifunctional nicotinamide-nucleotide adenylyltransferase/Nudix hydroxylase [Thiotrichales bacterium 19S9-12]|nr:bifunctional nicotinamide-nucleotide adenylyltransferase/Nudix hydroxylase [Thiotrichales bacterium 19S9-11]MCF6811883.1 bifunctional nicotinamide-nucleotide adenylyltransferase/Nudix hydroxylase [Thiotrichales bacterium 19S9-12]
MKYQYGVFIGRFQPFHSGHYHVVKKALINCESLILLVGSANRARNIKNPFGFDERKAMIRADLLSCGIDLKRIHIEPINDYYYDEEAWINEVKQAVNNHVKNKDSVLLIGHNKDSSSYYLSLFPSWSYQEVDNFSQFNATEFRYDYFIHGRLTKGYLVKGEAGYAIDGSYSFLLHFENTEWYRHLQEEYHYVREYKASWQNSPYPPIFTTIDALVICKNHLLLIKRGGMPGRDLFALPGGFLEENEKIVTGIARELKEETALNIDITQVQSVQAFDHPERSLLGRVISHVGVILLETDRLPGIMASDDAKEAKWVAVNHLYKLQSQFFDDHYQIIRSILIKL